MAGLSDKVKEAIDLKRYSGNSEDKEKCSLTHKMISGLSMSRSGSMILYQVV
jgi:hypothetical protein